MIVHLWPHYYVSRVAYNLTFCNDELLWQPTYDELTSHQLANTSELDDARALVHPNLNLNLNLKWRVRVGRPASPLKPQLLHSCLFRKISLFFQGEVGSAPKLWSSDWHNLKEIIIKHYFYRGMTPFVLRLHRDALPPHQKLHRNRQGPETTCHVRDWLPVDGCVHPVESCPAWPPGHFPSCSSGGKPHFSDIKRPDSDVRH